ncbi:MAG: hypothetical protein QM813_17185 [Verrucomicrobiota bacterium]
MRVELQPLTQADQADAPPLTGEPTIDHDIAVQAALYRAAIGGKRWRETVSQGQIVTIEEQVMPDPKAAAQWLAARMPDRWAAAADTSTQHHGLTVRITLQGAPMMTIGHVIEGESQAVTPVPGLIRQDGG